MSEDNARVPFEAFKGYILSRIGASIFWGMVFLGYLTAHQMRAWWHSLARKVC